MRKRKPMDILAAVICVAALAYVFLWPKPLLDIAWTGAGRGDPQIVRISYSAPVYDDLQSADVTLSPEDSAEVIEAMRAASVRLPIPSRQKQFVPGSFNIWLSNEYGSRSQITLGGNGLVNQREPANRRWGEGTFLLYSKDAEVFLQLCLEWTNPERE